MLHKFFLSAFLVHVAVVNIMAQKSDSAAYLYNSCFDSLHTLIRDNEQHAFKKAVFLTENVFMGNGMEYDNFNSHIVQMAQITKLWMQANPLKDYRDRDSINFHKNMGIFRLMKDTIAFKSADGKTFIMLPYSYDFTDFFGKEDWGYMFISKLLATKKGNCHSLPYLYKIMADELGAICWLSLAPNHLYIKNRNRKSGWYNTELTSGTFPIDAWITASGYIPLQAIQNGIYMDTLSNQQAIALTVLDLAKGYEFQTRNYYDGFILKCCDLVLQYHPVNVQALLLKAETLKKIYLRQNELKEAAAPDTYKEMESLYVKLFNLGYREMPEKMYLKWLNSVNEEKEKYSNEQLKQAVPAPKKAF